MIRYESCDKNKIITNRRQFEQLYKEYLYVHYPDKNFTTLYCEKCIDQLANYVDDKSGVVYSAFDSDVLCGFVHGYIRQFLEEKRLMWNAAYVHSEYRRLKIGSELEKMLEKYAVANDCTVMELFVTVNNPKGLAFHRANGFIDSRIHMVKNIEVGRSCSK